MMKQNARSWKCGQRESDVRIALRLWLAGEGRDREFPAAGRCDHDVLFAVDLVNRRRGEAAVRKSVRPELLARAAVERADLEIARAGAETQPAGRDGRPAEVFRAGLGNSAPRQLFMLAQRNFPRELAGVEIDRI